MPPLRSMQDHQLTRLVAQGNREAFIVLYDRLAGKVHGLALRMMGEKMAAEEVTQDTFLKLWTHAGSFTPKKGVLAAWLLTVTRNTALDRIRRENRRPDFNNPTNPEELWAGSPNPDSDTEEARWRSLHFALHELPEEQRQVIELAYYHGMSQSQIAEYLAIPLGTIKTRIRLGMEKLRQIWIGDRSES